MSKKRKRPQPTELEIRAKEIDYDAVIARMAGEPLTAEQQASCAAYDALYDETHPRCTAPMDDIEQ